PIAASRGHSEEALAAADARVARGRQRRVAEALEAAAAPRARVGISDAAQPPENLLPGACTRKRPGRFVEELNHLIVAERLQLHGDLGAQPSIPSMAGRIDAEIPQRTPEGSVVT